MASLPLRCFMAMAFDRQDTDAVFDKTISPVVRRLVVEGHRVGSKPIRVDRVEHNDDIDDRILSELADCDYVIADLTYARPSVYFEAGLATSRVPVVFTCRRDHFQARNDDPHGNFRVHFDLQMKNIIPWRSPDDVVFEARLRRRLVHVLRPVVKSRLRDESDRQGRAAFERTSLTDRAEMLLDATRSALRSLRVRPFDHGMLRETWVPRIEQSLPSGLMLRRAHRALGDGGALSLVSRI